MHKDSHQNSWIYPQVKNEAISDLRGSIMPFDLNSKLVRMLYKISGNKMLKFLSQKLC